MKTVKIIVPSTIKIIQYLSGMKLALLYTIIFLRIAITVLNNIRIYAAVCLCDPIKTVEIPHKSF